MTTLSEVLGVETPGDLAYDAFSSAGESITLPPLRLERMVRQGSGGMDPAWWIPGETSHQKLLGEEEAARGPDSTCAQPQEPRLPNQPRRSIHFASSRTGDTVQAAVTTMTQSMRGNGKVPNGPLRAGT